MKILRLPCRISQILVLGGGGITVPRRGAHIVENNGAEIIIILPLEYGISIGFSMNDINKALSGNSYRVSHYVAYKLGDNRYECYITKDTIYKNDDRHVVNY